MAFGGLIPIPVLTIVNTDHVLNAFGTEHWIPPLRVRCLGRETIYKFIVYGFFKIHVNARFRTGNLCECPTPLTVFIAGI